MSWKPTTEAPRDTISDIKFGPFDFYACTAWDGSLTVASVESTANSFRYNTRAPLFCCTWNLQSADVIAGGAEKRLCSFNLSREEVTDVGPDFQGPISCVKHNGTAVIAASYERELLAIDLRGLCHVQIPTSSKVISMDCHDQTLVTADVENNVKIWDLRQFNEPVEVRRVRTTSMLRKLKIMPNGEGYAVSNMQSRIAVEYLRGQVEASYTFKSNRSRTGTQTWEPHAIYALAFDPHSGGTTLAVGGSDKGVSVWNTRDQVRSYHYQFPASVMALDYSVDGNYLVAGITDDRWRVDPNEFSAPSMARIMTIKREQIDSRLRSAPLAPS